MPNPLDLNGLQLRQSLGTARQVFFYSPDHTFSCSINDSGWMRSARVGSKQMPVTVELSSAGTVRLECHDETSNSTFIFFIPNTEYLVPLKR